MCQSWRSSKHAYQFSYQFLHFFYSEAILVLCMNIQDKRSIRDVKVFETEFCFFYAVCVEVV